MRLGIRNKIKLISLLPIILVFGSTSFFLYQSVSSYRNGTMYQEMAHYGALLNDLATQLAKERGMTSIYIASKGRKVGQSLQRQRQIVDQKSAKLLSFLQMHPAIKPSKSFLIFLRELPKKRVAIDKLKVSFENIFFRFYTIMIKMIFEEFDRISSKGPNAKIVAYSKAYINFAKAKEASGIERGFMSYILTRYTRMSDEELRRWIHYIGQADTYEYNFITDTLLKSKIRRILNDEDTKEIFDELANARTEILHAIGDGFYTIDPTLWFNLNTEKITILSKVQAVLQDAVNKQLKETLNTQLYIAIASASLWLFALVLAFVGWFVSRDITRNIKNLEKILRSVAQTTKQKKMEIDLDTTEGTLQAYKLLESVIEETKKEQIRAQEANEAKSLFLANMSHEIRTPLNGIVGFTELLKNTELNEEQKEFISIIEKSSESLLEIINNILDLSKIESNKVEIENIVFNPIQEFESAIDVYAVKASEKGISLGCFVDPSLNKPLKGDPTKIKEILINLLSNAVKFTNQGGAINIEIRRTAAQEPGQCGVSFVVEDTGVGISPDKQEHIFEAFSQADTSITRKFGGTGLGLTISASYARLMGGALELESQPGKGSKFYFTLQLEELPIVGENLQNRFEGMKLAFLRNEEKSKKQDSYLKEYLNFYGATLIPFGSIEELIKIASQKKAHIVLIDADYADDATLIKMTKAPLECAMLIKTTQQKRIEMLKIHCNKVIYEPLNASKTVAVLELTLQKEEKKEPHLAIDQIGFDAKVLVAEDNAINQKLIKRTLEELGMQVDLAANGLEAFEKRRSGAYDIIFMDISMPVMDGVEATHEILDYEDDENQPHIPIIALTANALKGDRERFLAEGMDEYTTKPLVKEEIIAILKKFLSDKMVDRSAHSKDLPSSSTQDKGSIDGQKEAIRDDQGPKKDAKASLESNQPSDGHGVTKDTTASKKIVVLKKSPLESKIFANLLEQLGYEVVVCNALETLRGSLSEEVGIIFVDKEIESLDLSELKEEIKAKASHAALVLVHDPMTPVDDAQSALADEVILNVVNRDLVRLVVDKFIA